MRVHNLFGVLGIAIIASAAPSQAASRCTALKYRLAAKGAAAKSKCQAKAVLDDTPVDPACLAKAEAVLAVRWARAEDKLDCVGTGDLAAAQASVDAFIEELTGAIEPPPITTVCCAVGSSCFHGEAFPDAAACTVFGSGATPGAPGTVCDGGTGACVPPPASSGGCCFAPGFGCEGGPSLDIAGCFLGGGSGTAAGATCRPDGTCFFPFE